MTAPTPARTAATTAKARPSGSVAPRSASVVRAKAPNATTRQPGHPVRGAATPYASAKAARATRPNNVPSAARAANSGPCSRARIRDTGPDVRGKPASHPPTPGPQRRPASVARRISSGARRAFSTIVAATRTTVSRLGPAAHRLLDGVGAPVGRPSRCPSVDRYRTNSRTEAARSAAIMPLKSRKARGERSARCMAAPKASHGRQLGRQAARNTRPSAAD